MSQHTDCLYLASVQYNEEKHEALVEFSNAQKRLMRRYKFHPFTAIRTELPSETIEELLLSLGIKGFNVNQSSGLTHITAITFAELKRIGNALAIYASKKPLIIEPERAFLLQRGWSYLDSFALIGGELFRIDSFSGAADIREDVGLFAIKEIPFAEAMKLNEDEAVFMMKQAALSSLLALPSDKIPSSAQERTELFLENLFFRNGGIIDWSADSKFSSARDFAPTCSFGATSTIDFSLVWPQLLSNSFFNLGTETIGCECCKPVQLKDKNILPSSLIEVSFLDDNFFFESSSKSFALEYHRGNLDMDKRVAKKKEFFTTSYPVGPFFREQKALIPVDDAKRLLDEGKVSLGKAHAVDWFCMNKESFLSREVRALNARMASLRKFAEQSDGELFGGKGAAYCFAASQLESINEVMGELPTHLTNRHSKFFSQRLAKAILSIQESTLSRFREFSEQKGYRIVHSDKKSVFIKGYSSLALAKSFAKEESLPQPMVKAFSKQTRLYEGD